MVRPDGSSKAKGGLRVYASFGLSAWILCKPPVFAQVIDNRLLATRCCVRQDLPYLPEFLTC